MSDNLLSSMVPAQMIFSDLLYPMVPTYRGFEANFDSDSDIPAVLVLDFVGVEGGQFFAKGDNGLTFDDLHTFTRASLATQVNSSGLIEDSGGNNTHRLDHDKDGNRIGLLVEEARMNLSLWSDDWTNAVYNTVTNITALKDQTGADGAANSASSLLAGAANSIITQSITSGSATRVYSVHIKRITGTGNIELTQDGGSTWLDIKALINSSTYTQVATVAALVTNPNVGIRIVTDTDKIAVQYGDSEIGAAKTSPIPTTTVAVTRAAEVVTIATSDFEFNDTSVGAIIFNGEAGKAASGDVSYQWQLDDGSSSNRIIYYIAADRAPTFLATGGTGTLTDVFTTKITFETEFKTAFAWAVDSGSHTLDGDTVEEDNTGTAPTGITRLGIAHRAHNGDLQLNGHIKSLAYYAQDLTDADLIAGTV